MSGRIERRLAAAIVLTALIPLLAAVYLARSAVQKTSERFFVPEIGARLDESLGLYQDLARSEKAVMRYEATAIADRSGLVAAVAAHDPSAVARELRAAFVKHPALVSLSVAQGDSELAKVDRGRPIDDAHELTLEVHRGVGALAAESDGEDVPDDAPALTAVFATDRSRFEAGLETMSEFVDTYGKIAARRKQDENAYLLAFAVLLGFTIIAAIGVGALMARGVSTRVVRLAEATAKVGAGDLSVRVAEDGSDEVADLARAFNRMLAEVETSRTRIEYLQRIGAWQGMARRLAHEIKNPLTPIQLAVEEIHERYDGVDPGFRKLLDATLEVVEAEVGTLRRLVTEFSDFARLPRARLETTDLAEFLREQSEHGALAEEGVALMDGEAAVSPPIVSFALPETEAPAYLDRQMFRRVLVNLVRNSAQALRDAGKKDGHVRISLSRSGDFWVVDVDDDGPGIPADLRERVFDPYVTTKHDGTGLGLAIVKKIVVEHGGGITVHDGAIGGANVRVSLPAIGTAAATAAFDADPGSSGRPRAELEATARNP
ncbi:MAG TPA: ATP-binding protein [Polyangiaceae bacterium]|jgi:nitrogen fixation/metabolism regulation signal transduction histidine kinase|nr:ATP-binding protein [Polyangiaceae bacterium]